MISQEFLNLFYTKLPLATMSKDVQTSFLVSVTRYLDHGRKGIINGRTIEYVSKQLDSLNSLLTCIGLTYEEIVTVITNLPAILNTVDDLYHKFIFLGIVENEQNTFRKEKLVNKTADFMVGLSKMYARFRLISESGYNTFRWNSLVHASDKEFASIFIKGAYNKPYQLFENATEVYAWLANIDINELNIDEFKSLPVNEELVVQYERTKEESPRKN